MARPIVPQTLRLPTLGRRPQGPGLAVLLFGTAVFGLVPGQPGFPSVPPSEAGLQAAASLRAGNLDEAIATLVARVESAPSDPRAYRDLVDALFRRGDLVEAEGFLRSKAEADPSNPSPRYALGKLSYLRSDLAGARAEAEAALRCDRRHGYAHLLLGLVEYTEGNAERALGSWKRARLEMARSGDRIGEALAWNNLAMVHLDLHEYERARSEYERTLFLHRALRNLEGERIALSNLGLTLIDMGQHDRAIPLLRESLVLCRRLHDAVGEGRAMEFLCTASQKMGAYEEARSYADSMITLARRSGNPIGEAAGSLNLAMLYNDIGEPILALRACERGLAVAESLGHPRYRSALLVTLGETEARLGRFAEASAAFIQCDSLSRSADVPANASMALAGLSRVSLLQGDTLRALQVAEEALAFCARVGFTEGEGLNAGLLSEIHLLLGHAGQARLRAERSLEVARRVGRRADVARALARRAQARAAEGDLSGALADAREGERIARAIQSPEAEATCALALGEALRHRDREEALEAYRAAISIVEAVQGKLGLDEFKAGYLQNRRSLYYQAADLLVELGRDGDALEISERSRARAFRDFLASGPPTGELPGGPRGEGAVQVPRPQDESTAEAITKALAPESAVLEYLLGSEGAICLVARREGVTAVRLALTAPEAASMVDALLRPLHAPRSLATLTFDETLAARLGERLLDPVRPLLQGVRRLFIVPEGALHYLPFELLPETGVDPGGVDGDAGGSGAIASEAIASSGVGAAADSVALYASFRNRACLADRYAIVYLPAAGLLCHAESAPGLTPATSSARSSPAGSLLGMGSVEGGLRHTTEEVERIARLYPGARILAGTEATESRFKELAPGSRILHLAAHGALNPAAPLYSGLRLAPDPASGEDGFLHAFEVLPLRLDCELVTLSACESGLGRLYAGEGLLGLSRSFLCAGARRTLVSLWKVNDPSTTRFMECFYGALTRGLPAAEALQASKREIRRGVITTREGQRISLAHPFFWAPFILVSGGERSTAPSAAAGA